MKTSGFFDLIELLSCFDDSDHRYSDILNKKGKDIVLRVESLKDKFPILSNFPNYLSLFLLSPDFSKQTLFVGKTRDGEVKAFDCENNILDYKIESFFITGQNNYAFIEIKDNLLFKIPIQLDDDYRCYLLELTEDLWNKETAEDIDKNDKDFDEKMKNLTAFKDKYGNKFLNWSFEGTGNPPANLVSNWFYPYDKKVHEFFILDKECRVTEVRKKYLKTPKIYYRSEEKYYKEDDDSDGYPLRFNDGGECIGDDNWDYPGSPYLDEDSDIY